MTAIPITVNQVTAAGTAGSAGVAADTVNGNTVANNGLSTWIEVTNSDASVHHITIQPTRQVAGYSVVPTPINIPANTTVPIKFGPFSAADYSSQLEVTADSALIHLAAYSI